MSIWKITKAAHFYKHTIHLYETWGQHYALGRQGSWTKLMEAGTNQDISTTRNVFFICGKIEGAAVK